MEIHPGEGVGRFRFGLTEPDLVRELGTPDKRYQTDAGVERLQYFELRVEFAIEPENGHRFGWAEVRHPDATLFGERVLGEPVTAVIRRVTAGLGEAPEHETLGSLETYFYPRNWVELSVRFGRAESVNLGVMYDENDEPQWPRPAEPNVAPDPTGK
ncbi:hypothetical protein [Zavarzinella formosa]|uniref:hypothetical protein n=1 Tax=Zavarzinella formosa TaxID=360055 RepID=UPI0002F01C4E|nr:hypothetical protein [Zavarzinella formosa]